MPTAALFIKLNKIESNKKLFIFPHAGGSVLQYTPLLATIASAHEVYVLNLPGRSFDSKEKSYTDFQTLMDAIYKELGFLKSTDEAFLLGHSLGGLIVYDLVRYFETNHKGVLRAFAISSVRAPSLRSRAHKISHLPDSEFQIEIEKIQALPDTVKNQKQALSSVIETLRNDFKLAESFPSTKMNLFDNRARGYLFGADHDSIVSEDALSEWIEKLNFQSEPQIFPGDHFYIFKALPQIVSLLLQDKK